MYQEHVGKTIKGGRVIKAIRTGLHCRAGCAMTIIHAEPDGSDERDTSILMPMDVPQWFDAMLEEE